MYASHLPQRLLPDPDTTGSPRRERNRGILIPPPKSNPTRIDKQSTRFRHRPFSHDGPRRIGLHSFFFFFFVAAGVFYTTDNRIFSSPIILSSPLRSPIKIRVASLDPAFPFVIFPRFSGGIGLIDESAKCNRHAMRSRSLVEVELVRLVEERSENRL